MKLEDFKTLDIVTFEDNTKGVVYVRGGDPPCVVNFTTHTWCVIRGDDKSGFRSSYGKIVKAETGINIGDMCQGSREEAFDWIKPREVAWKSSSLDAVRIGNITAEVVNGIWTCEGVSGDLSDVEKVMELFTEPDKPKLEAYDLVQIWGSEENLAAILPSPDKHEGNFAAVFGRITLGKWIPSGRMFIVDFSDSLEDEDIHKILRWDNVNYAFGWFNGGGKHMYQAKEIWARKQTVRIANTWDAHRIGDIVKVGCQEVRIEQIEELIRKLKETAK